jgi:hypothetical protein
MLLFSKERRLGRNIRIVDILIGDIDPHSERSSPINKDLIRLNLAHILDSLPGAKPSRATLQSVNSFLMS